jgi:hypothetical protein
MTTNQYLQILSEASRLAASKTFDNLYQKYADNMHVQDLDFDEKQKVYRNTKSKSKTGLGPVTNRKQTSKRNIILRNKNKLLKYGIPAAVAATAAGYGVYKYKKKKQNEKSKAE